MAAFYQERGIDAGAMEDWRDKANEDLPFIIYHFSFVIGGFKFEVQTRSCFRSSGAKRTPELLFKFESVNDK